MRARSTTARALLVAMIATAADAQVLRPIAKVDPYVAVPGGRFLADAKHQYRVVFEARRGAEKPDQLIPALNMAGSELNTLAAHHVPRANVHFVVVLHTTASNEAALDNAHYRAKHGIDNPNLPVIAELKRQGVEVYLCGQSWLGDGLPLSSVDRSVTIAEDGVVVLMTFGAEGYAQLVF
jgi:intracellular sulfur oxidation DsrE/DsrF family protein